MDSVIAYTNFIIAPWWRYLLQVAAMPIFAVCSNIIHQKPMQLVLSKLKILEFRSGLKQMIQHLPLSLAYSPSNSAMHFPVAQHDHVLLFSSLFAVNSDFHSWPVPIFR